MKARKFSAFNTLPALLSTEDRRLNPSACLFRWAQRANQELTLAIVSNKPIRTIRYTEPVTGSDGKTRTIEKEKEQTDIHIVWEEWVVDCLEAGGRWKEDSYSVEIPKAELKRQKVQSESSLDHRQRQRLRMRLTYFLS